MGMVADSADALSRAGIEGSTFFKEQAPVSMDFEGTTAAGTEPRSGSSLDILAEEDVPCDRHALFYDRWAPGLRHWTPTPLLPRVSTASSQATAAPGRPRSQGRSRLTIYPSAFNSQALDGSLTEASSPRFSARSSTPRCGQSPSLEGLMRLVLCTPGSKRIGLLVAPGMRVGPESKKQEEDRCQVQEPLSGNVNKAPDKLAALLSRRSKDYWDDFFAEKESSCEEKEKSLKELVEAATGVPILQQKLCSSKRGPLEKDDCRLVDYDIADRSVITLAVKPSCSKHVPPRRGPWVCRSHVDSNAWQISGVLSNWNCSTVVSRRVELDSTSAPKTPKPKNMHDASIITNSALALSPSVRGPYRTSVHIDGLQG